MDQARIDKIKRDGGIMPEMEPALTVEIYVDERGMKPLLFCNIGLSGANLAQALAAVVVVAAKAFQASYEQQEGVNGKQVAEMMKSIYLQQLASFSDQPLASAHLSISHQKKATE